MNRWNSSVVFLFVFCAVLCFVAANGTEVNNNRNLNKTANQNRRMILSDSLQIEPTEILLNYVNAIGGKENLLKIKDKTVMLTGDANGITVSLSVFQKAPGKFLRILNMGTVEQKIVYDGNEAAIYFMGRMEKLSGYGLKIIKAKSGIHFPVDYKNSGIKPEFAGVEFVNGRKVYKIKLTGNGLENWYQYFDADTWLKVKEEITVKTAKGSFKEITGFSDYRKVNNVKFPFEITQSYGMLKINFRVERIKINSGLEDGLFKINE